MDCPQCGTKNPDGAQFCSECGGGLALVCPQCGWALPPQAKFCHQCGTKVTATRQAEPEAFAERLQRLVPKEFAQRLLASRGQVPLERRMVTILFSDVMGSTAMAEGLDPEDVLEIMDGAFDLLIEPITRFEGTLARLMGDAVLAFFGAPIAHEDDPERACRAALQIAAEAQRYAERLRKERGIEGFDVRVGIHTGLVVVGEVGSDLRVEYTAMGDAINLAARLEQAAEPGTVLVSEDTQALIASLFETEALGPVEVKGKAEPVPVYRVLAARAAAGKVRGIPGLESPLVGRQTECAALSKALARLQAGAGGIVTLVGEAGIGKSRLVAELAAASTHSGLGTARELPLPGGTAARWVEGRCLSYGASIAYLLWLDVLRGLLDVTLEDMPETVRRALQDQVRALCSDTYEATYPFLARLLSLPLENETEKWLEDLDGAELRDRTFHAVEMLIECGAMQQPLVLICEDLHWADPTSLQLLEHLLPLTERLPLLLFCVFRPVHDHRSWHLRASIAQNYAQCHTELCLEPLSAADSEALVTHLLWAEGLPPLLTERILSRAEGNPFYLEEVIRSLIDTGAIVQDGSTGHWRTVQDIAEITIPDTLQGVLVARIDRLQEETRRVLQLASVIGRIFLYRVLQVIAEEERNLDRQLLTLQQEKMIRERARLPELEYIFKHELTREAAYNGLLKRDRRVYHRQVARVLESLFPARLQEQVGLLAHHWERAGDEKKATEYLLRAGDQARLAYAHDEAVDYYQRALVFLRKGQEYERAARTLMRLGLAHLGAFDHQRARQAHEEGFALWQRAGQMEPAQALPTAPHGLRLHLPNPPTLDPGLANERVSTIVADQLFSGLVSQTPELSIEPDAAQSWEVSACGHKHTFYLRGDLLWSDGVPVTAHDFEYAWKRVLDPTIGSRNASLLYDVAGARAFHLGEGSREDVAVKAVDERTLVVKLEGPVGYFLQLLAYATTYPLPRHAVESHGRDWFEADRIVTNGPFRLESCDRDTSMVLRRNPTYHGQFRGNVDRVELALLSEGEWSAQLERYGAGVLDVLDMMSFPSPERIRARQRYPGEYITGPLLSTAYVGFNVSRPPFDDARVRRALVLATDREWLADVVLGADESPATGGYVPAGMPGHSAGIGLPYDPDQARALLAEAGYPGGRGFPAVDAVTITGSDPYGDYPEAFWRENLGLDVRWETLGWAPYFQRLERDSPHLFGLGWVADYSDPDTFLRANIFGRYTHWRDPAYDGLVERARRCTVQADRMKLYAQADRILVQEAVILPLAYQRRHLLLKPWVSRYPTSALRGLYCKDVVIEPH